MRVKQTARKSTAHHSPSLSSSPGSQDAVQTRMRALLQTKRKSATPSQNRKFEPLSGKGKGKGKGKRLPYSSYHDPVRTRPRARHCAVALREIKRLQDTTDMLIPKAPFHRLVRELTRKVVDDNYPAGDGPEMRYQTGALDAIQEACESYLTAFFEDSYLCTIHAKRVTLFVTDMMLCKRLQARTSTK